MMTGVVYDGVQPRIGESIETFTVVAVQRLRATGRPDLDDPVQQHL